MFPPLKPQLPVSLEGLRNLAMLGPLVSHLLERTVSLTH